jgi:AraC family carnitine catabolism transcriptional activator
MLGDNAQIQFFLLPDFPLYALVPAIEALRIANQNAGERLFDWSLASASGGAVRANNGMDVDETLALGSSVLPRFVIVCSGNEPTQHLTKPVLNWLRRLAAHGSILGALDTGTFALAAAGVLGGYRVTLHWEAIPVFRDAYPEVDVVEQIFVIDRERVTAAGGVASLDLMLALIAGAQGPALAQTVADAFVHGRARPAEMPQLVEGIARSNSHTLVQRCVRVMKENIAYPMPIVAICDQLSISRRRLERLFMRETGWSPRGYYVSLRLEAAREQLFYSENSIGHIAEACGFLSNAHFCRAFRRLYGAPPTTVRRRFERSERGKLHPAGSRLTTGTSKLAL